MLSRSLSFWVFLLAIIFCSASVVRSAEPPPTIFKFEEVETKPALKKAVHVYFPRSVRRKGEAVQIKLRFAVMKDGHVDQVTVVKVSNPAMIEPALEAYSDARYTPGIKGGQPVNTWMEVTESAPAL